MRSPRYAARMTELIRRDIALEPDDIERLANLSGPFDQHLRQIELRLGVGIANRGNLFRLSGDEKTVAVAEKVLRDLYDASADELLTGPQIKDRKNKRLN